VAAIFGGGTGGLILLAVFATLLLTLLAGGLTVLNEYLAAYLDEHPKSANIIVEKAVSAARAREAAASPRRESPATRWAACRRGSTRSRVKTSIPGSRRPVPATTISSRASRLTVAQPSPGQPPILGH